MKYFLVLLSLCCWASVAPAATNSPVLELANSLRGGRCGGRSAPTGLMESKGLDAAARRLAQGQGLAQALDASAYRARRSSALTLSGIQGSRQLTQAMHDRFCTQLRDAEFTELGSYQRNDQLWLVIAAPHPQPRVESESQLLHEVLALTNAARATPRRCGAKYFEAVPALQGSALLDRSADIEARDMAQHHFFDHTGSDGSTPGDRAKRAGYQWRAVGENIALGPETAREVVDGWLASPGHCENMMDGSFTEMGIASELSAGLHGELYWSQTFGRPK